MCLLSSNEDGWAVICVISLLHRYHHCTYYYRIRIDILKLAERESEMQVLCWFVFCEIMHSVGSVLHTNCSNKTVCLLKFDELPCGFVSLASLNIDVSNKQITIEHTCIKYSYSYMFRLHRVIIRLVFRIY